MTSASTSHLEEPGEPLLFDAILRPHRSLSPTGLAWLMGFLGLISTGAGLAFYLIGAWPVVGFLGIDVALLYLAFRVSNRRARAFETVRLTPSTVTVEKVSPRGRHWHWASQAYWLRVELDEARPVRLRSHGRSVTVGAFLGQAERADFAQALGKALKRLRG